MAHVHNKDRLSFILPKYAYLHNKHLHEINHTNIYCNTDLFEQSYDIKNKISILEYEALKNSLFCTVCYTCVVKICESDIHNSSC